MANEMVLKRLILVKRLFLAGVENSTHPHNYSEQLLAVINLFLSIEALLVSIINENKMSISKPLGTMGYISGPPTNEQVAKFRIGDYHKFEQLYNQAVTILRANKVLGIKEKLFEWNQVDRLHKARNDAQHGAKAPHPSDLIDYVNISREFIEKVLQLGYFEAINGLANISFTTLIQDNALKAFLVQAETEYSQSNYKECVFFAYIAFLLGRMKRRYDWWKDREGHEVIDDYDMSAQMNQDYGIRPFDTPDARLLANIIGQTIKLPRLYDNLILGLELVERDRLHEIAPRIVNYPSGTIGQPPSDEVAIEFICNGLISGQGDWTGPTFNEIPSKDDSLWVIDYVSDTLVKWENEERNRYANVNPEIGQLIGTLRNIIK